MFRHNLGIRRNQTHLNNAAVGSTRGRRPTCPLNIFASPARTGWYRFDSGRLPPARPVRSRATRSLRSASSLRANPGPHTATGSLTPPRQRCHPGTAPTGDHHEHRHHRNTTPTDVSAHRNPLRQPVRTLPQHRLPATNNSTMEHHRRTPQLRGPTRHQTRYPPSQHLDNVVPTTVTT